ncbi:FliH/SctL family protein [Agromyces humi]|uniref:FliH/SctL family protein n=1 Tax=Agromyces humi TaxID=1766800 RepID=UPI001357A4EA|nr:FliH/SctL family protein [Agromyces humi]
MPGLSGRKDGFAAGYADGARAAEQDNAALRTALQAEHDAAEKHRDARVNAALDVLAVAAAALDARAAAEAATATESATYVALEVARHIIDAELSDTAHAAHAALTRALQHPTGELSKTVRLHPDDITVLSDITLPEGVTLAPGAGLNRGDSTVDLDGGYLDATITAAYERAADALRGGAR